MTTKDKIACWDYRELGKTEESVHPQERQLFEDIEDEIANHVVRESVQNFLDERIDTNVTARATFIFGNHKADYTHPYYKSLYRHIKASNLPIDKEINNMPFLVIEDFNTKGLIGPTIKGNADPKAEDSFLAFYYQKGKSIKIGQANKRGNWGLGKLTFFAASKLNSIFGLSISYKDAKDRRLMGKSYIEPHWIGGSQFTYEGYYGDFSNDDICEPVRNPDEIREFASNFGLTRSWQSGFSIVIPDPKDGLNVNSIKCAVIINYAYAIFKAMLEVEIKDGKSSCDITADNIREIAKGCEWEQTAWKQQDVDRFLEFIEDVATNPSSERFQLAPGNTLFLTEELFGEKIDDARAKFENNELVFVRIGLLLEEKDKSLEKTYFEVAIRKDNNLTKSNLDCVREGIVVTDAGKLNRPKANNIQALINAEDPVISRFLGDSENTSHMNWVQSSERIKKYKKARAILSFIKNSVNDLLDILDTGKIEKDWDWASDIFSIKIEEEEEETPDEEKYEEKYEEEISKGVVKVSKNLDLFNITKSGSGTGVAFHLINKDQFKEEYKLPMKVRLKIAYDTGDKNGFSSFKEKYDFTEDDIKVAQNGCEILDKSVADKKGLIVVFNITSEDFYIELNGFDPNRDLQSQITEVK